MIIQKWFQPIVLSVIARVSTYVIHMSTWISRIPGCEKNPYILLPFEQLKNSIQWGGLKKYFPKFDCLLLPLDNKVIVSVTITDFDFGNNRFVKKIKKPSLFYSVLQSTTNAMNTSNYFKRLKSLIVSIVKKCKHEKIRQIIFRQMFYRVLRKIFGTDGDRVTTNRQRETCIFRHYAICVSHIQRSAAKILLFVIHFCQRPIEETIVLQTYLRISP